MSTQTSNLKLEMPDAADNVSRTRYNSNLTKIDDAIAKKFYVGAFPNDDSKLEIATTAGSKFVIYGIGTNQWCHIVVNVSDANMPRPNIMQQAASAFSCSSETGKLTILTTSSNACTFYAIVFAGSISQPSPYEP